ncbi:MAG: NUDIX domain-containing protein [Beijerinckiaceae bacterium]|nr:NUDIX domain-containing protein [Beijerinckiaceae bacterium]
MRENICIRQRQTLSCGHGVLEKLYVERRRFDGHRQSLSREVYDSGDGAAILLYDPKSSRVVLVRQFRAPAYLKDNLESMIEVCAGRLEGEDAETRIIKEAEEETGFIVRKPRRLFDAYMSPGCFAEKLTFFAAEYTASDQSGKGGGRGDEGEDIEVIEPTLDEALAMVHSGEIIDAKTILLLQYAKLSRLMRADDAEVPGLTASP